MLVCARLVTEAALSAEESAGPTSERLAVAPGEWRRRLVWRGVVTLVCLVTACVVWR